ncbi:reverse transcriptase domain-containing protein [Albibacterium profundi]|uniref:RNA-directed DNA polymerase n=1 Tax=Albibacterium profundi TaxID=3134906 RepID=A0ABV5CF30_9SPHI
MKRIGNLYQDMISIENLKLADINARKGKLKSYGVKKHIKNEEANILALHDMLKNRTYRTSKYDIFTIVTDNGKERTIYRLPYFPDRICHHAAMASLEPIWNKIFIANTFSCIKGRGIHGAAKKVKEALRSPSGNKYCLKIDIKKFYPNIDHDILKQIIRKKIKDQDLLWLLDEIIDSADGVPIGNYLSQFFANLYLAYFDHWIKEVKKVRFYFRYADDVVILMDSKEDLNNLLNDIRTYLHKELKLTLKENFQIFPVAARGIDFVGYVFFHTHTLLRKTIKKKFCRRVYKLNKRKNILIEEYRQLICPWLGWTKYCDSYRLLTKILNDKYDEVTIKQKTASAA